MIEQSLSFIFFAFFMLIVVINKSQTGLNYFLPRLALSICLIPLRVAACPPPVNDNCAGAITLTPGNNCVATSDFSGSATLSIAAITCGAGGTGNADDDLWYKFVATTNAHTINVTGTAGFDPVIDLRSGACNGATIACADASTGLIETLNATGLTIGATYYIRVYHFGTGGGSFDICVTSSVCKTPIIACDKTVLTFTPLPASSSGTKPSCFTSPVQRDTWIKFDVVTTGTLQFTGNPISSSDQYDWALYDITAFCPGTLVSCNYNYGAAGGTFGMNAGGGGEFNAQVTVTSGKTYVIIIDNYSNTPNGFNLSWGGTFLMKSPIANAGTDLAICLGGSTTIGGAPTASGGTPGYTYSWTSGAGTTSNPTVSPASSTNYTVTVTDANACIASDAVFVTVNALATANANADQIVCASSPVVTLAGSVGGSATGGTWSGGAGTFSNANVLNATYTPSAGEISTAATVTLTLTTTGSPCGSVNDQMIITINAAANANANADQSICAGSSAFLSGSVGGSATTGTWSAVSGSFSPNASTLNASYTPIAAGTYTLTLTTNDPAGPCPAATDQMIVTVNPLPIVNAGVDIIKCPSSAVTLGGSPTASGGGPFTYSWSPTPTLSSTSVANPVSTVAVTTTFTVTVTNSSNGCMNNDAILVTVPSNGGAGTWTWLGTTTDWFDACNWDKKSLPDASSDVSIPGGTPNNPTITGSTGNCKTLNVNTTAGGHLNINTTGSGHLNVAQ